MKVNIHWIEAEGVLGPGLASDSCERYDGILVPGGFGKRGIDGMINAIRYAREHKVPYFGICLGMQTLVIEFARNVCGLEGADSTEFDPGHAAPRDLQAARAEGRRRAGRHHAAGRLALPCWPKAASRSAPTARARSASATATATSSTANTKTALTAHGLRITGETPDGTYVEICEIAGPSLVPGLPVPPRVQVQAAGAAPAVHGLHRRRLRAPRRARSWTRQLRQRRMPSTRVPIELRRSLRRRPPAGADRRAVRDRERGARPLRWRARSGERGRAVRLQGLLRQGQPHAALAAYRGPGLTEGLRILAGVKADGLRRS